jgi:hypothetical protein
MHRRDRGIPKEQTAIGTREDDGDAPMTEVWGRLLIRGTGFQPVIQQEINKSIMGGTPMLRLDHGQDAHATCAHSLGIGIDPDTDTDPQRRRATDTLRGSVPVQ